EIGNAGDVELAIAIEVAHAEVDDQLLIVEALVRVGPLGMAVIEEDVHRRFVGREDDVQVAISVHVGERDASIAQVIGDSVIARDVSPVFLAQEDVQSILFAIARDDVGESIAVQVADQWLAAPGPLLRQSAELLETQIGKRRKRRWFALLGERWALDHGCWGL